MSTINNNLPSNLIEAMRHFSNPIVCLTTVAAVRWPNGPICPKCSAKRLSFLATRLMWKCLECKKQFTVKVGTIFEDSPISLDKWMLAMWMLANCKNGINSYEIARDLSVTQKTAWFMLQRLRHAMLNGTFEKMTGEIEADETYIGGRAKNMHKSRLAKNPVGTGGQGKTIVLGFRNRGGDVKAEIIPDAMQVTLRRRVKENVEAGS